LKRSGKTGGGGGREKKFKKAGQRKQNRKENWVQRERNKGRGQKTRLHVGLVKGNNE